MRTHMKYQHYEKNFLENLENEFNLYCIPEEDKRMLISIWRRKGHQPGVFTVGKNTKIDFSDDSKFIYVQNGKYHHSYETITSNGFIALRKEGNETSTGAPIYTVYVSTK